MADPTSVSAADLKTIQTEHESAEDAETGTFNPAIKAASTDAATALQNGKIKNKVVLLSVTFEVTALQIQQAQGKDTSSQITEETTKWNSNIKLDQAAAGQASTSVDFSG
ncbi:hypothetical protein MMC25_005538 [Agyrium rufum]|nr:hypothetical protein [Agyrium rufum]